MTETSQAERGRVPPRRRRRRPLGAQPSDLSAAQQVASARGANLHVVCMGADTSSAANASAEGVTAVHAITHDQLGDGVAETYYAAAMQALTQVAADVVIAPSSSVGKGYLPRLAEQLGCGMVTEILSVESGDTFTRALWAGSVIATVQGTGRLVVSVRATGFEPAATQAADVQAIAFEPPQTKTRFVGREKTESARPDLSEASVVVSGGRGTKGDFAPIEQLADALGAAMGASRAACDAGWVPNDLRSVRPVRSCAEPLHRCGSGRRDPAHRRDEGLENHRCDQQGRGGADLGVADMGSSPTCLRFVRTCR